MKTGEEDEEAVFKHRCKLYRFDSNTKEWKEKGTGEMKILKHKLKANSYRVLMRRDQVLKLCANHKISGELKLENMNEKQLRWVANDCSEGEARPEMLAVKFRHEDEAKSFRVEFEKAQQSARLAPAPAPLSIVNKSSGVEQVKNSLAALLVKQGDWKCGACLATNKEAASKCACCETPKPVQVDADSSENGKLKFFWHEMCAMLILENSDILCSALFKIKMVLKIA